MVRSMVGKICIFRGRDSFGLVVICSGLGVQFTSAGDERIGEEAHADRGLGLSILWERKAEGAFLVEWFFKFCFSIRTKKVPNENKKSHKSHHHTRTTIFRCIPVIPSYKLSNTGKCKNNMF